MKMSNQKTLILAGAAVLGLWYMKSQSEKAIRSGGAAINPTNPDNIFNRGAQGLWDSVTDGEGTIGTDIYDFFNPDPLIVN